MGEHASLLGEENNKRIPADYVMIVLPTAACFHVCLFKANQGISWGIQMNASCFLVERQPHVTEKHCVSLSLHGQLGTLP